MRGTCASKTRTVVIFDTQANENKHGVSDDCKEFSIEVEGQGTPAVAAESMDD